MNGDGFTGLEPNIDAILFARAADKANQAFAVVERLGDPVTTAHVEVGELGRAQEVAKLFIDGVKGGFEVIGILLAEGVEM